MGVNPIGVGIGVSVGVGAGVSLIGFNTPVHSPLGRDDVLSTISSVIVEVSIGGFGCNGSNFLTISASSPKNFGASRKVTKSSHQASGLDASEGFSQSSLIMING